jgi:hypothetical protein
MYPWDAVTEVIGAINFPLSLIHTAEGGRRLSACAWCWLVRGHRKKRISHHAEPTIEHAESTIINR